MSRLERWGLPLSAFALYWLCRGAYYVGFFNDDAFYIIGARSLLSGRYAQLNVPGAPPLVQYLPGASVMLLPAAAAAGAGSALWPYQLACAAMAAGAIALLADAWRGWPRGLRFCALAVFALSPLATSMSAAVLSDVPLLFLAALALALSSRRWEADGLSEWLPLLGVFALAALSRPTGVLVGAAAALALAYKGRWRQAAWCAAAAAAPVGLWLARNRLLTGVELPYIGEWLDAWRAARHAPGLFPLWGNLSFYLRFVLMTTLLRWPWPWKLLEAATIGMGFVAFGYGLLREDDEAGWETWPKLLVPLFFAVHLLWSKQAGRYVYPILPLCAAYWLRGAGRLAARAGRPAAWGWSALAAASVALSLIPDGRIMRASLRERNAANTPPAATALWMREHALPQEVFAAELDGRWHLLSGRSVIHLPRVHDAGALWAWLSAQGARYVLVDSDAFVLRTPGGLSDHDPTPPELLGIFLSDGRRYKLLYSNEEEGARIYGRFF